MAVAPWRDAWMLVWLADLGRGICAKMVQSTSHPLPAASPFLSSARLSSIKDLWVSAPRKSHMEANGTCRNAGTGAWGGGAVVKPVTLPSCMGTGLSPGFSFSDLAACYAWEVSGKMT